MDDLPRFNTYGCQHIKPAEVIVMGMNNIISAVSHCSAQERKKAPFITYGHGGVDDLTARFQYFLIQPSGPAKNAKKGPLPIMSGFLYFQEHIDQPVFDRTLVQILNNV
jgi:hypothetical protein